MPEALAAIPSIKMPTGNSSETETSNTDRSYDAPATSSASSAAAHATRKKQQQLGSNAPNKKSRRSNGRRAQKKPPLKATSQVKTVTTAAALHLKSHIPRALLLTPSTSSTSLTTNVSPSPREDPSQPTTPRVTTRPATPLQRQNTIAILKFRARKSISQMDLKHMRRTGNYSISGVSACISDCVRQEDANLVPNVCADMGSSSQNSLVSKMLNQENYYCVVQKHESKVAGMKIFATIMLNAWRKRRDEVKRLSDEVNDLKRCSIKAKNQLHVFNTLFRVEQRRNDELNCQLKRSLEDIGHAKSSCESLTTSLISLKADKALLEQELQLKEQEFDGLNAMLTQTKSDLFKAMTQQRELQAILSVEQRKGQTLENQKNDLINEICELNNDALQKADHLCAELKTKDAELAHAHEAIKKFEQLVYELRDKDAQLRECTDHEFKLKKDLESLECEVGTLRQCLNATLDTRLKTYWHNTLACQRATFQMLHWIAFCMLPATPPPKITKLPFGLSFEKALSVVKR